MIIPLDVISSMTKKNNKKVKLMPLSNMVSLKSGGKDTWGEVTIMIPSELVVELAIKPEEFIGGLLLVDRSEYDKEKALLEREEKQ